MKLTLYAFILFSALATLQARAQTKPEQVRLSFGGSAGHLFTVNGIPYETQIDGDAIASSPDWQPETPPPVDSATAAKTARRQLKELVEEDAGWQVDEISLCRVSTAPEKWYYRITFAKSFQGHASKTIPLLVDFSGRSGKVWMEKSMVNIWVNMAYDDALAAIKLCDGVHIIPGNDPEPGAITWSFNGYDAIVALRAENGRISGMTYWTRKDFESNETSRTTTSQRIKRATFFTHEKKVSINTVKQ